MRCADDPGATSEVRTLPCAEVTRVVNSGTFDIYLLPSPCPNASPIPLRIAKSPARELCAEHRNHFNHMKRSISSMIQLHYLVVSPPKWRQIHQSASDSEPTSCTRLSSCYPPLHSPALMTKPISASCSLNQQQMPIHD